MAIEYAGGEILRVPVHRLDLVERWVGESESVAPPTVHRIGGKRWKTLKRKTGEAIEMMTVELLQLYARREAAVGFAFSPDTLWQKEMESSFLYEDTPDQRTATEAVKRDMESTRPMDRLICGDVGYGKTEIAIRAAFKVVQDGRQVAVLAPTTVLVEQHRHTFGERLADYPVRVGALSRFRTPADQKKLLQGLSGGEVDIVVGTHRLLSSDVEFADLGLLIVDEEQRFGVRHKETPQAVEGIGGRVDANGHAHPTHITLVARGPAGPIPDPYSAAGSDAGHHACGSLVGLHPCGGLAQRVGPRRTVVLPTQSGFNHRGSR